MDQDQTCNYVFRALDEGSDMTDKYIQIFVEQFDALEIYIAEAKDTLTMQDRDIQKVTSDNRNFTMSPTKRYYIQINATEGANQFQVTGRMIFRYYKFDPKCPEFTKWDGSECMPDYTDYCASLTDYYR
jgi:hypothetical protein